MASIVPLPDLPNTIATFVRQDPVIDPETGEVIDTVEVEVEAQYCWRIKKTSPPPLIYYVCQCHNPWEYLVEDDESEKIATMAKIGLTGSGFQRGEVRYAGESPRSIVSITQAHFDAMVAAGIVVGPGT